jgi:hypothetical protein
MSRVPDRVFDVSRVMESIEGLDITVLHRGRNTVYVICGLVIREDDLTLCVIYKDRNMGRRWVRPARDFFAGAGPNSIEGKWTWGPRAVATMESIRYALEHYEEQIRAENHDGTSGHP